VATLLVVGLDYAFDDIGGGEGPENQGSQKCELQKEVSLKGKYISEGGGRTRSVGAIDVKVTPASNGFLPSQFFAHCDL
jgi:hypothetical protein